MIQMEELNTNAILIRRIDYGDYDLILTFLSRDQGKITAIAKSAKKSAKRFSGVLELFTDLSIRCRFNQRARNRMPVLTEAFVKNPYPNIRVCILKTAYASYFAELINATLESLQNQEELYYLFRQTLNLLDSNLVSPSNASVLFQMKFARISGITPNLVQCTRCRRSFEEIRQPVLGFDIEKGGLVCSGCRPDQRGHTLTRGAVKQLTWIEKSDLSKAARIRFSKDSESSCCSFLETFINYHLGVSSKSLSFLKQLIK